MPAEWKKVPLVGDPYQNADETELDAVSAQCQDCYINELGHTVKRPGLTSFVDTGVTNGIDGLYWSEKHAMVIAVVGGRIFKITDLAGTKAELTGATMSTGTRVTFAEDGTRIGMANSGAMVHFTPSGTTLTTMADAQAPTTVSHLAEIDGYWLANDLDTDDIYFSDPTNTLSWAAADLFAANFKADDVIAMRTGWKEVIALGEETVEVFYNDGVTPFARMAGGVVETGGSAPHTLQKVTNAWAWLDNKRQFVRLTGRTPEPFSKSIDKLVQDYSAVDDAVSDTAVLAGQNFYLVHFPGANVTQVYNEQRDGWHQWGNWNTNEAIYNRFRGQSYCYAKAWNKHLFGDRANGIIYEASSSVYTDNGSPIRSFRRTGFISHGTTNMKRSSELVLRLKRGAGNSDVTEPQIAVRWRNDGGAWGNEHWVSLGAVGEHQLTARLHNLGEYRMRQYEVIHSDASAFVLVDAQELVEVLPN